MKRIWAPWRKHYVEQGTPEGCIFCLKAAAGDDVKQHVIARGESCFSMLNRFPYNSGHLMVSPFRHLPGLGSLDVRELTEMMVMVRDSISLLDRKLGPDGFNVGINLGRAAGAGVADHVHIHIVPRWEGDTNFMLVLGETRVIPHALDEMYEKLTSG